MMTYREFLLLNAALTMVSDKLDKLISLLEVRQGAENSSSDSAQVDQQAPDEGST